MASRLGSAARATYSQLASARRGLLDLASKEGLSDLRLAPDATLFVHVDNDSTYRPVLRFVAAATKLLGAEPNVVVDEAPSARAKLSGSSPL